MIRNTRTESLIHTPYTIVIYKKLFKTFHYPIAKPRGIYNLSTTDMIIAILKSIFHMSGVVSGIYPLYSFLVVKPTGVILLTSLQVGPDEDPILAAQRLVSARLVEAENFD